MANTTIDYGRAVGRVARQARCLGYADLDPGGRKIGVVGELFCNDSGEPEYVGVRQGLLGLKGIVIRVPLVASGRERRTITLQ